MISKRPPRVDHGYYSYHHYHHHCYCYCCKFIIVIIIIWIYMCICGIYTCIYIYMCVCVCNMYMIYLDPTLVLGVTIPTQKKEATAVASRKTISTTLRGSCASRTCWGGMTQRKCHLDGVMIWLVVSPPLKNMSSPIYGK